jgi:hypothetical protein
VEDHLVDEVRFQRGCQHAAAHEGDVFAVGGLACRRDRVLDAAGDERLAWGHHISSSHGLTG